MQAAGDKRAKTPHEGVGKRPRAGFSGGIPDKPPELPIRRPQPENFDENVSLTT